MAGIAFDIHDAIHLLPELEDAIGALTLMYNQSRYIIAHNFPPAGGGPTIVGPTREIVNAAPSPSVAVVCAIQPIVGEGEDDSEACAACQADEACRAREADEPSTKRQCMVYLNPDDPRRVKSSVQHARPTIEIPPEDSSDSDSEEADAPGPSSGAVIALK